MYCPPLVMVMVAERSATCSGASGDGAAEGGWIGVARWIREICVEVGPLQADGEHGTRAVYAHNACYLCPRTFLYILVHFHAFFLGPKT